MSRIYFHSQHGEAELRGSERAHMGVLCADLAIAVLRPAMRMWGNDKRAILKLMPPDTYVHRMAANTEAGSELFLEETIHTWFSVAMNEGLLYEGRKVPCFDISLNTALRDGSDVVKLMARLHGQCEIHAYVEGPNREWLADLITTGRAQQILRPDQGWEDVVKLLLQRDDEPVVTSYSVCDQFPNNYVAVWDPPEDYDGEPSDAWYDLPEDEQWRLALEGIRESSGLEMRPDNWRTFHFMDGVDAFQIAVSIWNQPSPVQAESDVERLATALDKHGPEYP